MTHHTSSLLTHLSIIPQITGTAFPVSDSLTFHLLNTLAIQLSANETLAEALPETISLVFNFRDKSYSAEQGGFHPVEMCLSKGKDNQWQYVYITDFAYMGNYYPELEKALDFDFTNQAAYSCGIPQRSKHDAHELYQLWEHNFIAYLEMGCYDEIQVSTSL